MTEPAAREIFDPYHKWMGISPKDQPPHYYRLLAIDLFESDAEVISAAADKQMAFIRSFQTGKNSQLSQKILNEIATARVCLLNAAKKAEYDLALRARLAAAGSASGIKRTGPIPVVAAAPAGEAVVFAADVAKPDKHGPLPRQLGGGEQSQIRKKRTQKATIVPLVALGAMVLVCAIAVAVVMSRKPETQASQSAHDPDVGPLRNSDVPRVKPAAQDSKLPVPGNIEKPATTKSPPRRPMGSGDGIAAATSAKLPEVGAAANSSGKEADPKASGKNRLDVKPRIGDDPFASKSNPATEPEGRDKPAEVAKPAEAEKPKTPEDFEKQLADAKTPEDYRTVAGEALRAAGQAMDDNRKDTAMQLMRTSLGAARKSGDSKLINKATRALIKPESVKEILAEKDQQDEGS